MKVISGMNFLRGLEVMRIREKMEDLDKTLIRTGIIFFFFFLVRSSKAEL